MRYSREERRRLTTVTYHRHKSQVQANRINADLMLSERRRRWADINPEFGERLKFSCVKGGGQYLWRMTLLARTWPCGDVPAQQTQDVESMLV